MFDIFIKDTTFPIGYIKLLPSGEIKYALNDTKIARKQGYMSEALLRVRHYLEFVHNGILYLTIQQNNEPSQKVAKRCGFINYQYNKEQTTFWYYDLPSYNYQKLESENKRKS